MESRKPARCRLAGRGAGVAGEGRSPSRGGDVATEAKRREDGGDAVPRHVGGRPSARKGADLAPFGGELLRLFDTHVELREAKPDTQQRQGFAGGGLLTQSEQGSAHPE